MAEIRMPKMGDGMEEGTILRWIKREGDTVAIDEPIAEIETDKANVEMPADEAGTLSKIVVKEGDTVPVGAVIAYIGDPGAAAAPTAPSKEPVADRTSTGEAGTAPKDAAAPAPSAPVKEPAGAAPASSRIKASPLARRIADEAGINLAKIQGSGPNGRVVERDVKAFQASGGGKAVPASTAAPAPLAATAAPSLAGEDVDTSKMRRAIARRTVQSKQTIPHFYITMPIEMDRALDLLKQLNEQTPEQKVTVNDLIVKACAVALTTMPEVNVSYTPDDKVRHYGSVNIGIAVGTDDGLTIPVVKDCQSLTLRQISAAAKGLVKKARTGALTPAEMSGGTFSVSNLGMFGVEEFSAIINPPESAILAVGAAAKEVVVDDNGDFVVRRRMRVTLSSDHRTVDGLLGAKFVQEVKRLLESPFTLLS